MRIEKKKFYLLGRAPGISGFRQWDKIELRLASGYKAANDRPYVIAEFIPRNVGEQVVIGRDHKIILKSEHILEFENGKLPGGWELITLSEAGKVLSEYPHNTLKLGTFDKSQIDMLKCNACLKFIER